jgi:hypothetical protein
MFGFDRSPNPLNEAFGVVDLLQVDGGLFRFSQHGKLQPQLFAWSE